MNFSPFQIHIILAPLLILVVKKKWVWFSITGIGYLLFILWGIYLYSTADITEYGTAYGLMIIPWIIVWTLIGYFVQQTKLNISLHM